MTALVSYSTGTVSVASGGTTVTGVGSIWSGTNVRPGDVLQIGNFQTVISDVTDTTHLVIPPWGGGAQSGVAYQIWQVSPQRFAGAQAMQAVNDLVAALNVSGFFWFVATGLTAPDPSYGDDGQYAYQPSTGAYWLKTGGVWVASGSPAAGYGGTSTTSLAIGTGSKVFTTQSGLAYNGARVRAAAASDATKWMEGVATYAGTTLTITVDKTGGSGTFASWTLAIAGQPATGDMSSANNLSDVASASASRGNIAALGVVRVQTFTASGTYTPNANMLYAIIECQGGGGSGGAVVANSGSYASGSGGGGGCYARKTVSKATVGAPQTVTVGAGGAAPSAGANSGSAGGTTSVGTLCSAVGGAGGSYAQSAVSVGPGASGGSGGTGDLLISGSSGGGGSMATNFNVGWGGGSAFGGSTGIVFNGSGAGAVASGAGGSAGFDVTGTTNRAGGAGGSGSVVITEFCSA